MEEEHMVVEASFDTADLESLTKRVKRILDIRDRKYGFPSKTYLKCFVGSEAVTQLVEEGIASDEEDAVHIGNMMRKSLPGCGSRDSPHDKRAMTVITEKQKW